MASKKHSLDALYNLYMSDPTTYTEPLFTELLRVVTRVTKDDDIAQDTVIVLMGKLPAYVHEGKFSHWVRSWAAFNRKDSRRTKVKTAKTHITFQENRVMPAAPTKQFIDLSGVRDPVDRMLAEQVLQGETICSIADTFGISRVTIHTRLRGLRNKVSVL